MTTTSVIVVCHRPGDWLEPCLESALPQADEVIVVDNGSEEEGAANAAERLGARAVRANANLGFAAGVNLGVRNATGDLIGLLNDDAVADGNWIGSAAALLGDAGVAAVTPKVLLTQRYAELRLDGKPRDVRVGGQDVTSEIFVEPGRAYVPVPHDHDPDISVDGELQVPTQRVRLLNHAGMFLDSRGLVGDYGLGAPDDGRFDQHAERFGCSGAAPVFTAETFHRVGRFAEEFFAYNEDFDWCFRARLAGMRFLYDPRATVDHRKSTTFDGNDHLRRLTRRNQLLTLVRNAPAPVALEHLARATFSPHVRGARIATSRRIPWAVASRMEMKRGWVRSPAEIWSEWAGVDNDWSVATPGDSSARPSAAQKEAG